MSESAAVYADPETGETIELDPVQADIYHELVREQGIHPRDAAIVAYLMDAVEPQRRRLQLAPLIVHGAAAAQIVGKTASWLNMAAQMIPKPLFWPTLEVQIDRRSIRLWTAARMRYIRGQAA